MDHPEVEERREFGRAARKAVQRSAQGDWTPPENRRDPVELLEEQNADRLPWLVPLRRGRMSASPFAFYRGTARIMAADLAATPTTGLTVQLGGDAHLANFGAYASPERALVFDANDFDETLRGPWEWDLKRLATSFILATRAIDFPEELCVEMTTAVTASYRTAMADHAERGVLDNWYDHIVVDDERAEAGSAEYVKALERFERRARSHTSLQALNKLTVIEDGRRRFRNDPPVLQPLSKLLPELGPDELEATASEALARYPSTLTDNRRWLVEQYRPVDYALKVVGVGSVGTRCVVALLEGRDEHDPLILQAKEANASVLEEHLGPSPYDHHGRRVVEGQRMIQAESDIFIGWTTTRFDRHYYVRQLRDWKGSVPLDTARPPGVRFYASVCGRALARAHARSGDAVAIASYLGKGDGIDRAITAFAMSYAAQVTEDHAAFEGAIRDGRLEADVSEAS
jgi:uncharacterized protein (DUF2252 family)